ncbi:MAG: choloylglycine hydrolase, partial [Ruminococcus sp.]|nr:choloylglycine hydrolase [Ruminococcus sp.]
MCTAATYKTKDFYFGRTLDYDFSYNEEVAITPRNYPFDFNEMGLMNTHYAMIGMAYVVNDYPLYYDAVNEKGLGMAGLNFVGNAYYRENIPNKDNIAQFEFIPWILSQCASVKEAKVLLQKINLTDIQFNDKLPLAQLHWIIADTNEAITVESVREGIKIYDNPVGVLTNNPTFEEQMFQLNNYMHLSPKTPQNLFSDALDLHAYSRGMGAMGLPGDLSSQSRFVRVSFVK